MSLPPALQLDLAWRKYQMARELGRDELADESLKEYKELKMKHYGE